MARAQQKQQMLPPIEQKTQEGYLPARDDTLPDRFFEEVIHNKYGKAMVLDRALFLEQRATWYSAMGLDERGVPPRQSLTKLGLDFVIPDLEKILGYQTWR